MTFLLWYNFGFSAQPFCNPVFTILFHFRSIRLKWRLTSLHSWEEWIGNEVNDGNVVRIMIMHRYGRCHSCHAWQYQSPVEHLRYYWGSNSTDVNKNCTTMIRTYLNQVWRIISYPRHNKNLDELILWKDFCHQRQKSIDPELLLNIACDINGWDNDGYRQNENHCWFSISRCFHFSSFSPFAVALFKKPELS